MLRLDFIYVCFADALNGAAVEMARVDPERPGLRQDELGRALRLWLGEEPSRWPRSVKNPVDGNDIAILPLMLGLNGEFGVIVAGSQGLISLTGPNS